MRIPIPPVLLPDHLVEVAREFADGRREPVEPRDAATVILLRASEHGPAVYYLRRQVSMEFAGGMCVYPGGGVDPRDFDADVAWAGPEPADWAKRLGCDEDDGARAGLRRGPRDLRGVGRAAGGAAWRRGGRRHHR